MPAVQQAREAARRSQCQNNFRQVGVALHNYHSTHGTFPPGMVRWAASACGMPSPAYNGWGWGIFLLPYVEQGSLYKKIDFSGGPGLNADNFQIGANSVPVFNCPTDPNSGRLADWGSSFTNGSRPTDDWVASCMSGVADSVDWSCGSDHPAPNRNGMLFTVSKVSFRDVTDGSSNTLFVGEITGCDGTHGSDGPGLFQHQWVTANIQDTAAGINGPLTVPGGRDPATDPVDGDGGNWHAELNDEIGFSSFHDGGCHFLLGDGAVRFLSENISSAVLANLTTRAGGEVVGDY